MTTLVHHLGEATQRELDFVAWLAELSAGVEWKYLRWFEDDDGGVGDDDQFCADCAELERRVRKHKGKEAEPYRHVRGWDEAMEEDSQPFCARCGVMLRCSPTRYCLEHDIDWLEDAEEMDATNAAAIHNWLTGMGDYQREKDWPAIESHAVRLMRAAGREVIDDGLVRFRPSDVWGSVWYPSESIWLSIYEHFAGKLKEWANGRGVFHFVNKTSGIGCHGCAPIGCQKAPHARLRDLFEHVGRGTDRQAFLDWLGLKTRADLDTAIVIPDDRCGWPTFDVRGRRLKRPGPNECHPEALVVTNADLRLHTWDERPRWSYNLFYDFNHWDRSSWCVSIEQADGQRLPEFIAAIALWMEDILEPADRDDHFRSHRLRQWDETRAALGRVFYFSDLQEPTAGEVGLTDALAAIGGGSLSAGRIKIDQVRFLQLCEWVEHDAESQAAQGEAMKIGHSIFASLFAHAGLPEPVAEHRFARPRRFAFDYAWPEHKVALEVEGGMYGVGNPDPFTGRRRVAGHGSIERIKSDMEKYNIAAMHGWRVLRCTPQEFERGDAFQLVCNAFKLLGVVE